MVINLKNTKTIAFVGISATLALLLSYVEFLLPPLFVSVPGIKIGLPNVVIIFALYCLGFRYAAIISFVRLIMTSLLFGNILTLAYSFAGAVLSLTVMAILKKTDLLSCVGVSVAGGVSHNIGQVLVAIFLLKTPQIAYYMLVLLVTGIISGAFVGLCGAFLIKRIPIDKLK
ncbi:MAG: Gx transporter family protein [Ruminococcaceae bacterium]|nr:Gx transporter family protein [Oscillospiraceae bacterium]